MSRKKGVFVTSSQYRSVAHLYYIPSFEVCHHRPAVSRFQSVTHCSMTSEYSKYIIAFNQEEGQL